MMCFGDPSKSLEIARERMTPEAWARFEREYDDFCVVNGMPRNPGWSIFNWAKWAFLSARPRELVLTEWVPCMTPPVRDGWYEVERNTGRDEIIDVKRYWWNGTRFVTEAPPSIISFLAPVIMAYDRWRGIQGEEKCAL